MSLRDFNIDWMDKSGKLKLKSAMEKFKIEQLI